MIDYKFRPAKRTAQKFVMIETGVKRLSFSGLGGSDSDLYKQTIKEYLDPKGIQLCDINPLISRMNPGVTWGALEDVIKRNPTNIVDCDYCASILTEGKNMLSVYKTMCEKVSGKKVLMFSFSTRMPGGYERTLDILNKILYDGTIEETSSIKLDLQERVQPNSFCHFITHKQSKFEKSILVRYRDYTNMLCGAIVWE